MATIYPKVHGARAGQCPEVARRFARCGTACPKRPPSLGRRHRAGRGQRIQARPAMRRPEG
eukprot:6083049-Lingulodinium_polyedra.AAC.1